MIITKAEKKSHKNCNIFLDFSSCLPFSSRFTVFFFVIFIVFLFVVGSSFSETLNWEYIATFTRSPMLCCAATLVLIDQVRWRLYQRGGGGTGAGGTCSMSAGSSGSYMFVALCVCMFGVTLNQNSLRMRTLTSLNDWLVGFL